MFVLSDIVSFLTSLFIVPFVLNTKPVPENKMALNPKKPIFYARTMNPNKIGAFETPG